MCVVGWPVWVRGSGGFVGGDGFMGNKGANESVVEGREIVGHDTLGSVDEELMSSS